MLIFTYHTLTSRSALLLLVHLYSALRALKSQHFDPTDIKKLAVVVKHITALDALSAETQVHCADLLVLCRVDDKVESV